MKLLYLKPTSIPPLRYECKFPGTAILRRSLSRTKLLYLKPASIPPLRYKSKFPGTAILRRSLSRMKLLYLKPTSIPPLRYKIPFPGTVIPSPQPPLPRRNERDLRALQRPKVSNMSN